MYRRRFLSSGITSLTLTIAPNIFVREAWAERYCNIPKGNTVTIGCNVPLTGSYAQEGEDELRASKLAVKHLNGDGDGGLIQCMQPLALKGNGILGKKVRLVSGDTRTQANYGRKSALKMIREERATMITGGSSSGVAIAVQSLCEEVGVLFMMGVTHSNEPTGIYRNKYGFRYFFNAQMSASALAPHLLQDLGINRRVYHLTANYSWGWSNEASLNAMMSKIGWETIGATRTPLRASDYSPYLAPLRDIQADVIVLNHYGSDLVRVLNQLDHFGLRDKLVNGRTVEIVTPLYSKLIGSQAGSSLHDVYSTANWDWSLDDLASRAFVNSFIEEYGSPPSQAAHTCYVQIMLYANACEIAESFAPPEVIKVLEGFRFSGMGNGSSIYREDDHQCFKSVLVVTGNQQRTGAHDYLSIKGVTSAEQIVYPPDAFPGALKELSDSEC